MAKIVEAMSEGTAVADLPSEIARYFMPLLALYI
mgnify:CR=1 FL=1